MNFLISLFKRKLNSKAFPFDFLDIDIHNHILPGLDDGAKDHATCISLLAELNKLGFSKVIASPKTITQVYPNTSKTIQRSYLSITNSIDSNNRILPTFLNPTSLYALDGEFSNIRKSRDFLTINGIYVLVYFVESIPLTSKEAEIIELIYDGYTPILIQPERFFSYHDNFSYYESLVKRGCHLGLNLLSLQGVYGKSVQKMAIKLLNNKLYSFASTGIMNHSNIKDLMALSRNSKLMKKLLDYTFLNSTLLINNK